MDDMYIDPASINLTGGATVNDLIALLRGYIHAAIEASHVTGQIYYLYHATDPATGLDSYKVSSKTNDEFLKESISCPQDADLLYKQQHNKPRPLPSSLVFLDQQTRKKQVIIARPDLCDSCQHNLHRAVHGHCTGLKYTGLT